MEEKETGKEEEKEMEKEEEKEEAIQRAVSDLIASQLITGVQARIVATNGADAELVKDGQSHPSPPSASPPSSPRTHVSSSLPSFDVEVHDDCAEETQQLDQECKILDENGEAGTDNKKAGAVEKEKAEENAEKTDTEEMIEPAPAVSPAVNASGGNKGAKKKKKKKR